MFQKYLKRSCEGVLTPSHPTRFERRSLPYHRHKFDLLLALLAESHSYQWHKFDLLLALLAESHSPLSHSSSVSYYTMRKKIAKKRICYSCGACLWPPIKAETRSSTGGCVVNNLFSEAAKPFLFPNGFAIKRCAVAWLACCISFPC